MFERTLESLIKGLRSHRGADEVAFVATIQDEIRHEVRSGDVQVKAEAVLKLTYLQMLGYPPASYASFPILEVMAASQYHIKQVGYLAAAQTFDQDTDVLILATNLVKKDLHSSNPLEVAVALKGLSHIVTPDLAQHLTPDIIGMMNHSKPSIRKRTILVFHSLIAHYPPALDQGWHRLQEKLDDADPSVVSATVNVVCELGRRYPKKFLALSPQLFGLLTNSTNNWMLIKLVKLFGYLSPHEPRLVRKLLPPIKSIISTTPALSLLYECINSVISGEMLALDDGSGSSDELAESCVDKLAAFLEDEEDRNLKYVALLSLVRILPTHPHLVGRYHEAILGSMEDDDLSIRMRALDLAAGMASRETLRGIVERLMAHLEEPDTKKQKRYTAAEGGAAAALRKALSSGPSVNDPQATTPSSLVSTSYRREIARRILLMGSSNTYAHIDDFEWYVGDVLLPLLRTQEGVADLVRGQLIDVTLRVRAVRPFAVEAMEKLLGDASWSMGGQGIEQLHALAAAAWICGEYHEHVLNPRIAVDLLLPTGLLPGGAGDGNDDDQSDIRVSTMSVCIHGAVKLFAHWAASLSTGAGSNGSDWDDTRLEEVSNVAALLSERLNLFVDQPHCEVAERAREYAHLFEFVLKDLEGAQRAAAASKPVGEERAKKQAAQSSATPLAPPPTDESTASWGESTALNLTASSSSASLSSQPRGPKSLHLLSPLFTPAPMGPVAAQAQKKMPPPPHLDLRTSLGGEWSVVMPEPPAKKEKEKATGAEPSSSKLAAPSGSKKTKKSKRDEIDRNISEGKSKASSSSPKLVDDDLEDVPIVRLSLSDLPGLAESSSAGGARNGEAESKSEGSKKKKGTRVREKDLLQEVEEMPPGVAGPDQKDGAASRRKEKASSAKSPPSAATLQQPGNGSASKASSVGTPADVDRGAETPSPTPTMVKKKDGGKAKKKSKRAAAGVMID